MEMYSLFFCGTAPQSSFPLSTYTIRDYLHLQEQYNQHNEYDLRRLSNNSELLKSISPTDDLAICWTSEYDYAGDAKFMEFVLKQNSAITPILSCPDDFDFSCIVIVADVIKQDDKVIWRRIGKVNHSAESFEQEKRRGILYTAA